jgi:heme/copper-type cytochrome/quinol oxidase subunit 4
MQGERMAEDASDAPEKAAKHTGSWTISAVFGVLFVLIILALAIFIKEPTPFQLQVFSLILALAAAGFTAMFPGFLEMGGKQAGMALKAGGTVGVFLLVYFVTPQAVTGMLTPPKAEPEKPEPKPDPNPPQPNSSGGPDKPITPPDPHAFKPAAPTKQQVEDMPFQPGISYSGEVVNNIPNGQGTMTYQNWAIYYSGQFAAGVAVNTGVFSDDNGQSCPVRWQAGRWFPLENSPGCVALVNTYQMAMQAQMQGGN